MQAHHARDLRPCTLSSASSNVARCRIHSQRAQPGKVNMWRPPATPHASTVQGARTRTPALRLPPGHPSCVRGHWFRRVQIRVSQTIDSGLTSDGKILHSSLRSNLFGIQRASNRFGCSTSAMNQPSLESTTFGARQDDRIQNTQCADLSPLVPVVMVHQRRNLQSILHNADNGSKMCSTTPPRQSRTSSTSRPRITGNGLRLVDVSSTFAPWFKTKQTRTDWNLCQPLKLLCYHT
jgi:hypothetical protein